MRNISSALRTARGLSLLIAIGAALASCSSSKSSQDQLVAKGNQFEVTVTELDQLLRLAAPVHKEDVVAARRAVLNQLIDDKLFADAALEKKMDREPDVMQQLEAAKRTVLAKAYATRLFSNMSDPSEEKIKKFYNENAKLFDNRTAYSVDQLPVTGAPEAVATYRSIFDKDGLDALQAEMQKRGLLVAKGHTTILDFQLGRVPPAVLATLKQGSRIAFEADGVSHVGEITSIEHGHITLEQAHDEVSQRILAKQRLDILKAEIDRLRKEHDVNLVESALKGPGK